MTNTNLAAVEKQIATFAKQVVRANRQLRRQYGAHVAERALRLGAEAAEELRQAARRAARA
jgi:hypothetical protein